MKNNSPGRPLLVQTPWLLALKPPKMQGSVLHFLMPHSPLHPTGAPCLSWLHRVITVRHAVELGKASMYHGGHRPCGCLSFPM